MTIFKTRSEISAAGEFIQPQEQLRSGSLTSATGTNRSLERLAENTDSLLAAAQESSSFTLTGGGTISLSMAGGLSWTSSIQANFLSETASVVSNLIPYPGSTLAVSSGNVLYVVLDRTIDGGSVSLLKVADMAAFLSVVAGSPNRLDFQVLGLASSSGITWAGGAVLPYGESLTANTLTESQYAQQSEMDTARSYQRENASVRMTGGGDLSWDSATNTLSWSQTIYLEFPLSSGINRILGPGSVIIPAGSAWYGVLSRGPTASITISTGVASTAGSIPDADTTYVVALHSSSDSRVYLADGTALSDSDVVKLGGVRSGVQWHYSSAGTGVQVLDINAAVAGQISYNLGGGELMVYRNGLKATASKAFWSGGVYPTGALNTTQGGLDIRDDYVEEDIGDGTGTRILWIADGQAATESVFHAASARTPDPPKTWPDSLDYVEAFVGVQGATPTIIVPDGVYGFERVWTNSLTSVKMLGGKLVTSAETYASSSVGITAQVTDMVGAEVLSPNSWHYLYLGPGVSIGGSPVLLLSVNPPNVNTAGAGVHPADGTLRYVASTFVRATSDFVPFTKTQGYVTLGRHIDLAAAFSSATAGVWVTSYLSTYLPAGVSHVRLRMVLTSQAGIVAGSRLLLETRVPGFPAPGQELYSIKPTNSGLLEFTVDMPLSSAQGLDVKLSTASFQNVAAAYLIGYTEGTYSSGQGLL